LFDSDWNADFNVFMRRQTLARILFLDMLYRKIIEVPGSILEFGCKYGASLSIFCGLRGIYEPFNFTREIYGFDSFSGFLNIDKRDGTHVQEGQLATSKNWRDTLEKVLNIHINDSPLSHLMHVETIAGDVTNTWPNFVSERPHLSIAMAYFDLDLYLPSKFLLENVIDFMPKGSLIIFDEFTTKIFPGETLALQEVLGIKNCDLKRSPLSPTAAYLIKT
jgi:hypothetical protein